MSIISLITPEKVTGHGVTRILTPTVLLIITLLALQSMAIGQEVEEVIIEAQAIETESLDDLASVSAIDAEKLADAGIENVQDVAAYVPNLSLTETETGTSICIRGICAGVNQGFDQSVGLFSDRVPLPRSAMARSPFLDLSGVQVLRGPQYVLDGNFSVAGSVHMTSDLSTDEFNAGLDFNYIPSQNDKKLLLTLGGPISDTFSAKLVTQYKQTDGYVENVFLGRDEPTSDELVSRLVLGFQPTDSLFLKLKAEIGQFDRKGRSSEIILDQPVPVIRSRTNGLLRETSSSRRVHPFEVIQDFEYSAAPLSTNYSRGASTASLADLLVDSDDPAFQGPGFVLGLQDLSQYTFAFSGRSFLRKLAEIHAAGESPTPVAQVAFNPGQTVFSNTAHLRGATIQNIESGLQRAVATADLFPGALDDELDFKRSVDADEFSNTDSLNLTLNAEYWLGESQIKLTTSYIDYEVEELIDGDHTPYNIIETPQDEEYSQSYHRLDFTSPEGRFIEIDAGVAYMDADLSYSDLTVLGMVENTNRGVLFNTEESRTADNGRYRPGEWARNYLGSYETGDAFVQLADGLTLQRSFEQSQKLQTAYFNSTQNWTDSFRTRLGLRYTHSKKTAVRDLALIVNNVRDAFFDSSTLSSSEFRGLLRDFGVFFGVQLHTDNIDLSALPPGDNRAVPALRGERIDEDLLPTLTAEWDVNESLSIFGKVSMANKLGGFDARSGSTPTPPSGIGVPLGTFEFEDEKATTYELGGTSYWDSGQLTAVFFYTSYKDLQVSRSDGRGGSNVDNAAGATNYGVEIEGFWQLTEKLAFNYSAAYIDFQFDDFKFGSCNLGERPDNFFLAFDSSPPAGLENLAPGSFFPVLYPDRGDYEINGTNIVGGLPVETFAYTSPSFGNAAFCDFEGKTTQFVPEFSGTFSFTYETEIGSLGLFKPTIDFLYNSGYETSVSQDELVAQDAYIQYNARLALSSFEDVWEVALVGENLANEKIVTYANNTFGAGIQGARGYVGFVRPPRSIGLNLRYQFY